jgi:hypothetical protein
MRAVDLCFERRKDYLKQQLPRRSGSGGGFLKFKKIKTEIRK